MKQLKLSLALAGLLALAGCVKTHPQAPQPNPEKSGTIVVFAADNLASDTAAILFNEHFIAALQNQTQFQQAVCQGDYFVQAQSVKQNPTNHGIQYHKGRQAVKVTPHSVTYLEVSKKDNSWQLTPVSKDVWQKKSTHRQTNPDLIRRLEQSMVRCG